MDLEVGIAAWIIQDGNYGDFASGASYRFALEFFTSDLRLDDGTLRPQLGSLGGGEYEAHGRVIRCTPSYWVVDFGVPAYQNSPPPAWVHADALVVGRVYIGVDPFFYFERLKDELGMPDGLVLRISVPDGGGWPPPRFFGSLADWHGIVNALCS